MSVSLNGIIVGNNAYPNNERMFDNISSNIIEHKNVANLFVQYQCSVDFENFIMLVSYINTLPTVENRVLNIWYVPYLRMDRQVGSKDPMIKGIKNILITMCKDWEINVLDPHVELELPRDCIVNNIQIHTFINHIIEKERINLICFPDKGAKKRYSEKINTKVPYTFADKKRDINTGRITEVFINENMQYNDASILIIDDICSYGGTSNAVAKQLKNHGAKRVVAWYSHTEMSVYQGRIFSDKYIDKVYTSNSIMNCGESITFLTLDTNNDIKIMR